MWLGHLACPVVLVGLLSAKGLGFLGRPRLLQHIRFYKSNIKIQNSRSPIQQELLDMSP